MKKVKTYFILFFLLSAITINAQFAPPAGIEGTTAIHKSDGKIVGWATHCRVIRGFVNNSDTTITHEGSNRATCGEVESALGEADGEIVSLGDGGVAVLSFSQVISNQEGYDFVVFENSFDGLFLELAHIEVSSDGERFIRIPSISLTQTDTQIDAFGTIAAEKIHNLAGKYAIDFGTPFDLDDIADSSGIDLQHISHVKIIDVVGSIHITHSSLDSQGNPINDPFPTPFFTCGFDLDAVGVLNTSETGANGSFSLAGKPECNVFPNPAKEKIILHNQQIINEIQIYNNKGIMVKKRNVKSFWVKRQEVDVSFLPNGFYLIKIISENDYLVRKFIKK